MFVGTGTELFIKYYLSNKKKWLFCYTGCGKLVGGKKQCGLGEAEKNGSTKDFLVYVAGLLRNPLGRAANEQPRRGSVCRMRQVDSLSA